MAPGLGQAAMCGSFAGMSSAQVLLLPNWQTVMALGLLTSALFEGMIHTRNLYLGLGGRLGLTAFIGVNVMALVQGVPMVTATPMRGLKDAPFAVMAGLSALGSVATIALREASDDSAAADPVRAASVIGLLAALVVGFGGFTDMGALATYGGAFVGMSSPSRLMRGLVPGKQLSAAKPGFEPSAARLLASFAVVGVFGGLVHALMMGYGLWAGGWGGKAGFCSFVGVVLYRGMAKMETAVKSWMVKGPNPKSAG
jgi:hypothetical protein